MTSSVQISKEFICFVIASLGFAQVALNKPTSVNNISRGGFSLLKSNPKLIRRALPKDVKIVEEGMDKMKSEKAVGEGSGFNKLNDAEYVESSQKSIRGKRAIDDVLGVVRDKTDPVSTSSAGKKPHLNFFPKPRSPHISFFSEVFNLGWDYFQTKGKDGWKNDDLLLTHWKSQGFSHTEKKIATLLGEAFEVWSPVYLMDAKLPEGREMDGLSARQSTCLRYKELYRKALLMDGGNPESVEFHRVLDWYWAVMGEKTVTQRLITLLSEAKTGWEELETNAYMVVWKNEQLHEHPELIDELKKEYPIKFLSFLEYQLDNNLHRGNKLVIQHHLILTALKSDHVWNLPDKVLIFSIASALKACQSSPIIKTFLDSSLLLKMRKNQIETLEIQYLEEWRQLILALKEQLPSGRLDYEKLMNYSIYLESASIPNPQAFPSVVKSFRDNRITEDLISELKDQAIMAAVTEPRTALNLATFPLLPLDPISPVLETQKFLGRAPHFQQSLQDITSKSFWNRRVDPERDQYELLYNAKEAIVSWFDRYYQELPLKSLELEVSSEKLLAYHTEFLEICRMFKSYPKLLDQTLNAVEASVGKKRVDLTQSIISGALDQRKMERFFFELSNGRLGSPEEIPHFEALLKIGSALDLHKEYATFQYLEAVEKQHIYDDIPKGGKDFMASILGEVFMERQRILYMSSRVIPNQMVKDQEIDIMIQRLMHPGEVARVSRKGISPTRRIALHVISSLIKQKNIIIIHDLNQWGINQELLTNLLDKIKSIEYKKSIEYQIFWIELSEPKPMIEELEKFMEKILEMK